MQRTSRIAVVGGGILGLATAYRLLEARPDLTVHLYEAQATVGTQQSSRNSGVVHAGIYYTPGSAKARLCVAGRAQMEAFCAENDVPYERTGKVVAAVHERELPRLRDLAARARSNGVEVEELDRAGVEAHEPHVRALAGLWSPATGTTDFGAVCRALARRLDDAGAIVSTSTPVQRVEETHDGVLVHTEQGTEPADAVVACAGLQADRFAGLTGRPGQPRIVPFRGSWLELRPERSHLVRGNVYPVPQPGLSFLGVHLTRRIDGRVLAGPNAVLALARHGRRPWQVDRRDLAASLGYRGTWRLGFQHAGVAASEIFRDVVLPATVRAIRGYVPEIQASDLRRGPWGVRAQLVTPDGTLVDDFVFRGTRRVVHVLNAPSPAATASLAIGEVLRDEVTERLA